jgi:bacteriocin biosynthesis cyclodehydratase domain-containing protein
MSGEYMSQLSNATIVTRGAFGSALGHRLRERLGATAPVDMTRFDPVAVASDPHPIVWAASCEHPASTDIIDAAAYRVGRPWVPAVFEHPVIRVGPIVRPGSGPCYRCFALRRYQHHLLPEHIRALHGLYGAGQSFGPEGFLPHHVEVAAALVVRQLGRVVEQDVEDGEVLLLDILSGRLATTRVVAVHGCSRCGVRDHRNDTWASLQALLALSPLESPAGSMDRGPHAR